MSVAQVSFKGSREVNEDSAVYAERGTGFCAVVADGLGAHGRGDAASQILIDVFRREFDDAGGRTADFFARAFASAQREILASQKTKNEMRTTCVALAVIDGRWCCGHAGDSRLYHFHKGRLRWRTLDHSIPQMLGVKEEEISKHPDRNILLRVVGDTRNEPRYDLSKERRLSKGDSFLLCSDGFWEQVNASCIEECLKKSQNANQWLEAMLAAADWSGAEQDNYTAIAVMM